MSPRFPLLSVAPLCTAMALLLLVPLTPALHAQVVANTTQRGTVKSVLATSLTVTTDAKAELEVTPAEGARILQLPPGSTDLKSAQTITLPAISAGDRVLVTGHPGDAAGSLTATRIILMKSSDIASLHASQTSDWQRRGTGGLVKSVSGPTLTVSAGTRMLTISTNPATVFRRYAGDSVKFEDAKPSTLSAVQVGDQLRVRGAKSDDGSTITAEEIVTGSFQNLAGALTKIDVSAGTVTLKDLVTKQTVLVQVTPNSDLRRLPVESAAAFARRHPGGAATGGASSGSGRTAGAGVPGSGGASDSSAARQSSMDLSQMLAHLPAQTLADLKPGDAVLIVGSQTAGSVTAVTLLSGVEQILSGSSGAAAPTLSPWSVGGGDSEGGGGL